MSWTIAALLVTTTLVPFTSVPAPAFASATVVQEAKAAATPAVNINTATADQLEALPGIGPSMAKRIVAYREKNGPFKKVEDLMNVQGIGEKSFLKLRPHLTVGGTSDARPTK